MTGWLALSFALLAGGDSIVGAPAQVASVRVAVPATVVFQVPDVSSPSPADGPITVSFDLAVLGPGQVLRISVKADGDLVMSGGPAISVSNISWTTSNVTNGIGVNGVLSKTVYATVFQSQIGAASGAVTLTCVLAPLGNVRAGTRQATLRWRFEAITP